jgi:DNA-binding response OmpR family regulator
MSTAVAHQGTALAGTTLLVVEDDYLIAKELAELLREHGAEVLGPVPDAARARVLLSEQAPHCALLDINLKGLFAFELAQELLDSGVPVIFTTGYNSTILPERFQRAPCLQKPLETRALLAMIKQQVQSHSFERGGHAVP